MIKDSIARYEFIPGRRIALVMRGDIPMSRFVLLCVGGLFVFYGGWWYMSSLEIRQGQPPIWGGQYRAWFPGDLFLILFLAASVVYYQERGISVAGWVQIVAPIAGLAVGVMMFRFQISPEELADPWRMFAPTRLWHQLVIYTIGVYAAIRYAIPAVWSIATEGVGVSLGWVVMLGILGIVMYVACLVYDATHPLTQWNPDRPLHAPLAERYRTPAVVKTVMAAYHLLVGS